jgi:putative heme-binding domain-containing protein
MGNPEAHTAMTPALLCLALAPSAAPAPVTDLKLPAGFTAKLYADNPIVPDIYTMTIDDDGRVLVAGPGYVRVLVDDDGDGYADRAVDLIDGLKDGPMGLLAEGEFLFVVSDGGLKRYRGYNGKDKLQGPPETLLTLKTVSEHDAHAVRRGPDGWLYLLCGNNAGVRKEIITGTRSPVKEPIAGALVRLSPDFKTVEVVADGYRNPYSFDFNVDGEPFTYDSDNERCVGLPWYEGCRFYHIVPGGNYGWRSPQLSETWRKPPYFADVVAPVCDTGRGSPTGIVCYRHTRFPQQYRGGFFLADWTFGRIYHVPLKASGSSYSGKQETFAEVTGTSGFAPTALAVHPKTGELFVSIGGRGTRGSVFRISYERAEADPKPLPMAKRSLEFDKDRAKQWLVDCDSHDARTRRLALELMLRWWDQVAWGPELADAVKPNMLHADQLVRRAAGRLGATWPVQCSGVSTPQARITLALAEVKTEPEESLKTALELLQKANAPEEVKLEATRVIQLVFGDLTAKDAYGTVFEGYTFRNPPNAETADKVLQALKGLMPATAGTVPGGKPLTNLERELARTAAGLGGGDDKRHWWVSPWLGQVYQRVSRTGDVRDDLHLLACWGRLTKWASRDEDGAIANILLHLEERRTKAKLNADRWWPIRINELAAALIPAHAHLSGRLALNPDFVRLENLRFLKYIKPQTGTTADLARKFLGLAERNPDSQFAPEICDYLPLLPRKDVAALLDTFWERQHLQGSVVRVLARDPLEGDQERLIVGLQSLDADTVLASATALTKLKKPAGNGVFVVAVRSLRRFPDEKPNAGVRTALVGLLQRYSGQKIGADVKAWSAWLVKHDPSTEKPLNASDGFDAAVWQKRMAGIEWGKGDPERGRVAFTKVTCAACHDGARAVGPSLLGISKRFSRDDLLTAILQPSKDVSPRYRQTRIVTTDEKAYTGIIVYDAADGVLLQTGADTTIRIAGPDIASKKQVEVSLMPTGLIDKLSDSEIADLIAYLSMLGEVKQK